MRKRQKKKNLSLAGDAERAALGRNDVLHEVRSHREPPVKAVPSYRQKPEHGQDKLNPMPERARRAS